jgi:hypothetical protein
MHSRYSLAAAAADIYIRKWASCFLQKSNLYRKGLLPDDSHLSPDPNCLEK